MGDITFRWSVRSCVHLASICCGDSQSPTKRPGHMEWLKEVAMHRFQRICIWKRFVNERPFDMILAVSRPIFSFHVYSIDKLVRRYSTAQNVPCKVPARQLESKTHPLGWERIQAQVEPYFGNNWNFANEKDRKGFLHLGVSRAFSHFFPLTQDDRIDVTCKMLYLSFLIDGKFSWLGVGLRNILTFEIDQLEKMSFTQMLPYRDRVMKIALGTASPDRSVCLEWMLHDTVMAMRSVDEVLANDVTQGFCQLLQAQTSQERTTIKTLGSYLKSREIDMGRTYVLSLLSIFGFYYWILTTI